MYKIWTILAIRHLNIDDTLFLKLWTDIIPCNVSLINFEQSIGQKLPRINGFLIRSYHSESDLESWCSEDIEDIVSFLKMGKTFS